MPFHSLFLIVLHLLPVKLKKYSKDTKYLTVSSRNNSFHIAIINSP